MTDILGPQGWWLDETNVDVQKTIKAEEAKLDELGQQVPSMMQARPAKGVNEAMLRGLKTRQGMDDITDGVDLRYLEQMAFGGQFLRWKAQLIGSCVASGAMRAIAARTLAELLIHGQLEGTFGDDIVSRKNLAVFAPYIYRAGRKIGGLNSGDGSFCGAQIDGLRQYGCLPCDTNDLNSDAWPEPQNMQTYRKWGNSNSLLSQFQDAGRKWKLLETSRLRSADDFKAACVDGFKPALICSLWSFTASQRHDSWKSEGDPVYIYKRGREQWAHNMTLIGCVEVAGKWYAIVRNSWGQNAHSGRDWFPIPMELLNDCLRDRNTVSMSIGELDLPDTTTIVT